MNQNAGCDECTPYAWRRTFYPGIGDCCSTCGRIIDEAELVIVTNAPAPPRRHENPWGRGVRKDERGLPYLDTSGRPLKLGEPFDPKKYGKQRPTTV